LRVPQGRDVALELGPAVAGDCAFLTEMLVAAACWRTGAKSLSVRDILNRARALRHRLATVGASGVIAADPGPIGAAWRRCFPAHDPGYGFVEAQIPELSIGVVRERRGLGVGFRLLGAVITQARREKRVAVSLSVEAEDPARRCIDGSASSRSAELVGRRRRCCCWWL
jgi:GNAT superfamily N-acetyltransferase